MVGKGRSLDAEILRGGKLRVCFEQSHAEPAAIHRPEADSNRPENPAQIREIDLALKRRGARFQRAEPGIPPGASSTQSGEPKTSRLEASMSTLEACAPRNYSAKPKIPPCQDGLQAMDFRLWEGLKSSTNDRPRIAPSSLLSGDATAIAGGRARRTSGVRLRFDGWPDPRGRAGALSGQERDSAPCFRRGDPDHTGAIAAMTASTGTVATVDTESEIA